MRTAVATIARIPYLNSAPFYARWDEAPGTTVDLPPRALGEEARAGRADAGLMSRLLFAAQLSHRRGIAAG